jgi:carbamate kinase
MRLLLALGGNALTNAEGRARVEDQMAAARIAMDAVAVPFHWTGAVRRPRRLSASCS